MSRYREGDCVKPLRRLKRRESSWTKDFGFGQKYEVIGSDRLDGERLLVLKTGKEEYDYQLVYPDEVVKVNKSMCRRLF